MMGQAILTRHRRIYRGTCHLMDFICGPLSQRSYNFARFGARLSGPEWTRVSLAIANIFIVVNFSLLFLPLTRRQWSWIWMWMWVRL